MLGLSVMTKAILGLVLLSALTGTGCSSSDGGSQPTLDGIWQVQSAGNGCVGTFEFMGSTFTENVLCPLANGGNGDAYEAGTFDATSTTVTLVPTATSCAADDISGTLGYTLEGSQLVLALPTTTIILEKMSLGTVNGGAVIQDGCWDFSQSPGLFTPGPITQL
jgi:hypothetical protein